MKIAAWLGVLALSCIILDVSAVGCLGENGRPVDWWIVYKLPNVKGNGASHGGFGYAYTDASTPLQITGRSLADLGALGHTLEQVYHGSGGYVMWNDEIPDGGTSSSKAHSKGVMGYSSDAGFLLRHSTPRFPPHKRSGYHGLPENEHIYGQTFLCTSVSLSELNRIAGQYLVMDAQIYDHNTPSYASNQHNLTSFASGAFVHNASPQSITFKTIGGTPFWDIAKSKTCDCDMWDKVAAHYGQGMNVLSWGRPLEPSTCSHYPVQNIVEVHWGSSISYKETEEHSKWGVTKNAQTICIGDINRMESQKKRGGGASCLSQSSIASSFSHLIGNLEKC